MRTCAGKEYRSMGFFQSLSPLPRTKYSAPSASFPEILGAISSRHRLRRRLVTPNVLMISRQIDNLPRSSMPRKLVRAALRGSLISFDSVFLAREMQGPFGNLRPCLVHMDRQKALKCLQLFCIYLMAMLMNRRGASIDVLRRKLALSGESLEDLVFNALGVFQCNLRDVMLYTDLMRKHTEHPMAGADLALRELLCRLEERNKNCEDSMKVIFGFIMLGSHKSMCGQLGV